MKPTHEDIAEAVDLFGVKHADLSSIVPSVAGPAVGAFLGKRYLGPRLGEDIGTLLGGLTGGIGGRYIADDVLGRQQQTNQTPQNYQLDSTDQDIPAWAQQGAHALQPFLNKQSAHKDSVRDMLLGEVPGYSAVQGAREQGWQGAVKGTGGSVAGGLGGGALGLGAGTLLKHLIGRDVEIPGIRMPLSHVLMGLGGTIGATKGFQAALGR